MPLIKSAIKRAKQQKVRTARLRPVRTYMKTMIRKLNDALKAGKKDEAQKMMPEVFSAIDIAVKKRLLHKNNAARKKSKLSKAVAGMK